LFLSNISSEILQNRDSSCFLHVSDCPHLVIICSLSDDRVLQLKYQKQFTLIYMQTNFFIV